MNRARPLGLVLLSSDYVRVHVALMMASAAAAVDRPVIVFVTMEAIPLALHQEGWRHLNGSARDVDMKTKGIADLETLLEACHALGVSFIACETGLRACAKSESDIRGDPGFEVAGLVTFLDAVGDGEIVSF